MEDLPKELHCLILDKIDDIYSIANMYQTSQYYRSLLADRNTILNQVTDYSTNWEKRLAYAAELGHAHIMQSILALKKILPKRLNEAIGSAFKNACIFGHINIAQYLHETYEMRDFLNDSKKSASISDKKRTYINNYKSVFMNSCRNGHKEVCMWLLDIFIKRDYYKSSHQQIIADIWKPCLHYSCKNNHMEMAKWIMEIAEINDIAVRHSVQFFVEAFKLACTNNNIEIAKWLITLCKSKYRPIDIHYGESIYNSYEYDYSCVTLVCKKSDKEMIYWLFDLGENGYGEFNIMYYERGFMAACERGDAELAEWFRTQIINKFGHHSMNVLHDQALPLACKGGNIDLFDQCMNEIADKKSINSKLLLENACQYGHIKLAKKIWTLYELKINIAKSFELACSNGHLAIAQWLIELSYTKPAFTRFDYYMSFCRACLNGHIEMAKLIIEMYQTNGHTIDIRVRPWPGILAPFDAACSGGHLELAQWLYELSVKSNQIIDIHADDEHAFRIACEKGYLALAQWLVAVGKQTNCPVNIMAMDKEAFASAGKNNHVYVLKWLRQLIKNK